MILGEDVYIAKNVVIKHPERVWIGSHVAIDDYFYLTTQLVMGDYCHISCHVSVTGGKTAVLQMGNFSHLAAHASLIVYGDENLGDGLVSPVVPAEFRDSMVGGKITIGDFVTVATGAIVAPGITLEDGCLLAANSFAMQDIPEWEIWAGNPARFIRTRRKDIMIKNARALGYYYE